MRITRKLGLALLAVFVNAACRSKPAPDDPTPTAPPAPVSTVPVLSPIGSGWRYAPADSTSSALICFDNAGRERVSIRIDAGASFWVGAGAQVRLSVDPKTFAFAVLAEDGGVLAEEEISPEIGRSYVYDVGAQAKYAFETRSYSSLAGIGAHAEREKRVVGAFFFEVPKVDFFFEPFPKEIQMDRDGQAMIVDHRIGFNRLPGSGSSQECTRAEGSRVCALSDGEVTIQRNGESAIPSANLYLDNSYSEPIEVRVDGAPVGELGPKKVLRIHLTPREHTIAAHRPRSTARDQVVKSFAEWKSYVWSPEKRASYKVETARYGTSFGPPPAAETLQHPGLFESDADFFFVPFPDTAPVSGVVGGDKKRITRM